MRSQKLDTTEHTHKTKQKNCELNYKTNSASQKCTVAQMYLMPMVGRQLLQVVIQGPRLLLSCGSILHVVICMHPIGEDKNTNWKHNRHFGS